MVRWSSQLYIQEHYIRFYSRLVFRGEIFNYFQIEYSFNFIKTLIWKSPPLYEWKSANATNVDFQFRAYHEDNSSYYGFAMRLRCDRKWKNLTRDCHKIQ